LKVKLGEHYQSTDEHYWYSLWKCFRQCRVSGSFCFCIPFPLLSLMIAELAN
jgi:hypothetical protein